MSPNALLLLLLAAAAADQTFEVTLNKTLEADDQAAGELLNDKSNIDLNQEALNATVNTLSDGNDTVILDGDHEEVVRKKRTFGDIVFRGLADVLGYNVARKPPQAAFPPPLAPVPGIDIPLQAGPAPAPAAPAPPAPAPAVVAPCGQPRAAVPSPCRAQQPPPAPRPAPPPCPKPRAAPRPKPRPTTPPPPPPPPPPCASPRANPTTAAPCAPAPPPKADSNLETISSNFQLNFNFNRNPVTQAAPTQAADNEQEQEKVEQDEAAIPIVPIPIAPKAAKLPPAEPRQPRVYVDAFVVRNGVARRVDTVDAKSLNTQIAANDDYLVYDEENEQPQEQYDDYEDVQESRDRESAVHDFGVAVDKFWDQNRKQKRPKPQKLPSNHYQNVHFGDRELANQVQLGANLQRLNNRPNRIPLALPEEEDDAEATTTTEDPKRPLRPRVLPPTEHNPNQIDIVTVRVPPIYKEKRPKKLHRERPPLEEYENDAPVDFEEQDSDAEGNDSYIAPRTEPPTKRKKKRKSRRKTRSTGKSESYTAGDYDYFGNKLPVSDEEKYFMQLTVPPPTMDADLARHEKPDDKHFLDDHERLREDPERIKETKRERDDKDDHRADETERSDEIERADSSERSVKDDERTNNQERADENERNDKLSPNARVHETGYQNNYVHATNIQVDDPQPEVPSVIRKTVKIGKV